MKKIRYKQYIGIFLVTSLTACGIPKLSQKVENRSVPEAFLGTTDTNSIATKSWIDFFRDPYLIGLIDTALANNQDLNVILQEISRSNNDIMAKKGELLPFVNVNGGAGFVKSAKYTKDGAVEEQVEIISGEGNSKTIQDYGVRFNASWEIDIWRKLRNSRDAAVARYLASIEGQNFRRTKLIQEIAASYYELLSLDKQLQIIQEYIVLQSNALKTVKLQKDAGVETELAVQRFEAEVLNTKGVQYQIKQDIIETENKINFLLGRYPQAVFRSSQTFEADLPLDLSAGLPSQLLENRPDVQQAELEIIAANLDVKVAKARFYPSFDISAGVGLGGINPAYLVKSPESILYSLAGDLAAPLINRKGIRANYLNSNSRQIQAVFEYEKTILIAYLEIYNQVSKLDNLAQAYELKSQEVDVLNNSVSVAGKLFKSARADYMEVLLTQRDALDSKLEQVACKKLQFLSMIALYKACGGGWK
jgi:multidrug efflux system outer membrane protein